VTCFCRAVPQQQAVPRFCSAQGSTEGYSPTSPQVGPTFAAGSCVVLLQLLCRAAVCLDRTVLVHPTGGVPLVCLQD